MLSELNFWIGVASGMFAGVSLGIFVMALMSIAKQWSDDDDA